MRFVTILLFILLTVADKIYGSEITIEAENGTVSGGYAVVDEYFASGYKAVRGSNEGSLAIPFRIEEPGTYYVRFRAVVVDEGYRQHPFHVFIDENDLGEHGGDVKGSFAWKAIMHGVRLEKGQHKLIFKKGEMGLVDRVRLSVLPSVMGYDSPESVETECKTADFIRVIDLGKLELTKDSICYLGTMVRSKTDQEVCIRVDSQLPIIL